MNKLSLPDLLQRRLRPILVELDPPRETAPDTFLTGAKELAEAGADVITIADCPIGRVSIDSSLLAAKLKREYGIEVLPHMACRDRNLNAIQALLMGLSMERVGSVLLVTGDPVAQEDREQVKGVFQLSAQTLAEALRRRMEEGQLSPFFLCGALNINALHFDVELRRAQKKAESGIRAFLTQPIASERAMENVFRARESLRDSFLLGGLFPIVSHQNACFLQANVNGVNIDDAIIRSYEGLDRAQGEERAYQLCLETARKAGDAVDGFYIMTPFRRVALVEKIMSGIRAQGL